MFKLRLLYEPFVSLILLSGLVLCGYWPSYPNYSKFDADSSEQDQSTAQIRNPA